MRNKRRHLDWRAIDTSLYFERKFLASQWFKNKRSAIDFFSLVGVEVSVPLWDIVSLIILN